MTVADFDQSMRPSSGVRPPKYDPSSIALRSARRRARDERRKDTVEADLGRDGDLVEHFARRVVGQDRHRLRRDDIAGVRPLVHVVQRCAGVPLAVQHRPVHGRPSAVARQQRAVHVQRTARRDLQQRLLQHSPVVEAEQEIRRERPDSRDDVRMVRIIRRDPRQAQVVSDVGDALEPLDFRRVVVVRDDERHDRTRAREARAGSARRRCDTRIRRCEPARPRRVPDRSRSRRRQRMSCTLSTPWRAGTSVATSRSSTARIT